MNLYEFWVMVNLALLRCRATRPASGFLQSQWEPRLPLEGWVYLWTFTLPGPVHSLTECSRVWSIFRKEFLRLKPWSGGVRVFEMGTVGLKWHVHVVGVDRIDVHWMRQLAQRSGFGRVNVRRIPPSKAVYVAKYLGKMQKLPECKGARLAAVFGIKGISRSDILVVDTWRDYVLANTKQADGQWMPWFMKNAQAIAHWQKSLDKK